MPVMMVQNVGNYGEEGKTCGLLSHVMRGQCFSLKQSLRISPLSSSRYLSVYVRPLARSRSALSLRLALIIIHLLP